MGPEITNKQKSHKHTENVLFKGVYENHNKKPNSETDNQHCWQNGHLYMPCICRQGCPHTWAIVGVLRKNFAFSPKKTSLFPMKTFSFYNHSHVVDTNLYKSSLCCLLQECHCLLKPVPFIFRTVTQEAPSIAVLCHGVTAAGCTVVIKSCLQTEKHACVSQVIHALKHDTTPLWPGQA